MKAHRWIAALLLAGCARHGAGQTTSVDGGSQLRLRSGATLPAQCTAGQIFFKTDAPAGANLYGCTAANAWNVIGGVALSGDASGAPQSLTVTGLQGRPLSPAGPADQSVLRWNSGAGQWEPGVAGAGPLCTVTLSATPSFDAAQCNTFSLMLGNQTVTSSTLVNAKAGQALTFIISQDATGGRSFVWPGNVLRACTISGTPGASSIVTAIYDGVNANATECTTTDTATVISGPTRSAPAAPSSGLACWFDATGRTWKCKDTSGNIYAAVLTAAGPTANQYLTYIDADGVPHSAPISASQLSDGTTGSGAVVLATDATIVTPTIASFLNAQHTHTNAAGGGQIGEAALNLADVTTDNASTAKHGFMPKLPGDSSKCLLGDGTYGTCPGGGVGTPGGGAGDIQKNGGGIFAAANANDLSAPQGCQASGGSGTTYACPLAPAPATYATGARYWFKADVANTGAATINFNSLGAKNVTKVQGGITTALVANDIRAGQWIGMVYDGTQMQMVSQLGNASSTCVITIGDPGAASSALADDNDTPATCANDTGSDLTITAVSCYANAGAPTVNPILTGGSATSILASALTCGTGTWAAGTVSGSPVMHSFSADGATCSAPPCTLDGNISTAGGTAKYLVIKIKRTP